MKRRQLFHAIVGVLVGGVSVSSATDAVARVGRPMTPMSVGGVRRRSRRRTRRRVRRHWVVVSVGMYVATLPYGCSGMRMYDGFNYYYCDGIYYRPVQQGTTVVYVVDHMDPGAETKVEFEEEYVEEY